MADYQISVRIFVGPTPVAIPDQKQVCLQQIAFDLMKTSDSWLLWHNRFRPFSTLVRHKSIGIRPHPHSIERLVGLLRTLVFLFCGHSGSTLHPLINYENRKHKTEKQQKQKKQNLKKEKLGFLKLKM